MKGLLGLLWLLGLLGEIGGIVFGSPNFFSGNDFVTRAIRPPPLTTLLSCKQNLGQSHIGTAPNHR